MQQLPNDGANQSHQDVLIIMAQPYLRYHLLLSVVLKEGVPGGPAHGWGGVESVREAIAAREQEEEEGEVGDESHHLGQADQLLVIF